MECKGFIRYLLCIEGIVLVIMILLACYKRFSDSDEVVDLQNGNEQLLETEQQMNMQPGDTEIDTEAVIVYPEEAVIFSAEVQDKLNQMSTEEKVAQMFFLTPEMLTETEQVTVAGAGTKTALDTYPVGGIAYSADNFLGKEQTAKMLSGVQQFGRDRNGLDLFLAVAETGGVDNSPLATANDYGIAPALTDLTSREDATSAAESVATYLLAENFNLNLMQYTQTTEDANVKELESVQIAAYEQVGIATVPQSEILLSEQLAQAPACVMLENINESQWTDSTDVLCSMSHEAITAIRNNQGFDGIIISGPLNADVVTQQYDAASAAITAVQAGNDMLYLPQDFKSAYQAILDAVANETIPMERINNAVGRILTVKFRLMNMHSDEEQI